MADLTTTSHEGAPNINQFGTDGVGTGIGDLWARWYDEKNPNITKKGKKGKYLMGPLDGDFSLAHDLGVKEIETGVKGHVIGIVPTSEKLKITLSFMMMTQKTDERIMGSAIPLVPTYAAGIETTVKTATSPNEEQCELTDPDDFKQGDTIEVICGDEEFGVQAEYVKIANLQDGIATFNPPISQPQETLSSIKKVESINKKAGGHKLPKVFTLQIVDQENSTEDVDVYTFKRFQIDGGLTRSKGKEERKGGFTGSVLPVKMSYVDDQGNTKTGYILYEKDTYFKQ